MTPTPKPTPCALSPAQEKLWNDTRTALIWHCPAFTHILYTLMNKAEEKHIALFTRDVPIAATDGATLLLNPETFFKHKLDERVFIVAHEILHCVFDHCGQMLKFRTRGKVGYADGKSLPYDQQLMNVAADLVINDALIESKVGAFNPAWLHDTKIATSKDSALDAYRKLYRQQPGGGKGKGQTQGQGQGQGFDQHLDPGTSQGKDPVTASGERSESEWQTGVASAMQAAKAMGRLPAGLERLFGEILNPQVDWRDKIAALFARRVGSGSYDWRRPDRRLIVRDIYAPGRSGFGAGTVVVAVDTSGSIGQKELDMFFAEMAGILEDVRPQRLIVMWCDAQVHRVDEVEEASDLAALRAKKAPGGGGTSFIPVFEEITAIGVEPDALVYLTDGLGQFPAHAPSYPVIWGNIYQGSKYPFGDVVDVPKQAA